MINEDPTLTPIDEQPPVEQEPLPDAPEADVPVPGPVHEDADKSLPYTIGEWSKLPNYECKLCPFATLDLPVMEEHQLRHTPINQAPDQARVRRRYMRRD